MSNRTLFALIWVVIIAIFVLFAYNFLNLTKTKSLGLDKTFVPQNSIKGMAIEHNGLFYTLNFNQQNEALTILNKSFAVKKEIDLKNKENAPFKKIIIYTFDGNDVELTPIGFLQNELVFFAPAWSPGSFLRESSGGVLKKMLSQTYDP